MTAQNIIHDQLFLSQKSTSANQADLKIAEDLRDTLLANKDKAAGLAANMIGKNKRIIAFYVGPLPLVMLYLSWIIFHMLQFPTAGFSPANTDMQSQILSEMRCPDTFSDY